MTEVHLQHGRRKPVLSLYSNLNLISPELHVVSGLNAQVRDLGSNARISDAAIFHLGI